MLWVSLFLRPTQQHAARDQAADMSLTVPLHLHDTSPPSSEPQSPHDFIEADVRDPRPKPVQTDFC